MPHFTSPNFQFSQSPDDIAGIPQLRARLEKRLADTKRWLSTTVFNQVQEMKEGLDLISAMSGTLNSLQATFHRIERLCGESSELMDEHDRLRTLSVTRENLRRTERDVEGILSIPSQAEAIEANLSEFSRTSRSRGALGIFVPAASGFTPLYPHRQ